MKRKSQVDDGRSIHTHFLFTCQVLNINSLLLTDVRQKPVPLLLKHSHGESSSTEGTKTSLTFTPFVHRIIQTYLPHTGSLMGEAPLEFYCLNSNMASFIPSTGDNTRVYEVLEGATSNFDFPFNNNISRI